jgi:DNA polymerase-3 subunit gamma/tau
MAKTAVETLNARDDSTAVEREHQMLYRKFRPRQFADVVGQDHIITPLKSVIATSKTAHAYLMIGPRGCGKTTTSRLLAAAVNCPNVSSAGEPCGECQSCSGIISGTGAIGVHEINAATTRGVNEMKDLIDDMSKGSVAKKKVYIIDEAHMLTKEASNALLKPLEEPPPGTLIILATTEAHKIMETIRSRTIVYNFKIIGEKLMTGLINEIVAATGMKIDADGIAEVVRRGHGSPRDTLSALEGWGTEDAADDVRSFVPAIAKGLAERDSSALIISLAEAFSGGVDATDLTRTLLEHWRNCLLALEAPAALGFKGKELDDLAKQAKAIKPNRVVRLLNVTSEALGKMSDSGDARLLLETTLLQVSQPSASDSLDGIYDRFEDVFDMLDDLTKLVRETKVSAGSSTDWPPAEKKESKKEAAVSRPEPVKENEPEEEAGEAETTHESPSEKLDVSDESPNVEADVDEDVDVEEKNSAASDESSDDDYDQWDDDDDDSEETAASDDSDDDSDDDDQDEVEPARDISELIKDDESDDTKGDDDSGPEDDEADKHDHDEDEASGFLDCGHPECVAKLAEVKKAEKSAPKKAKVETEKESTSKVFYEESKAPTARDLVEIIQHDLIERKFSRYLQDTVMDAEIEEEKGKVFLVLTHRKGSDRIPTKDSIDAITACVDNLWVDEIEYNGKER